MKRVLLLNQGHTDNYGDIAINDTLTKALTDMGVHVCFIPLWSAKSVFKMQYFSKPLIRLAHEIPIITDWLYRKYITERVDFKNIEAIIIGGGELIGGHYGFHSALCVLSELSHKYNIPLYVFGVSGSKKYLRKKYIRRNAKAFTHVTKAFVRDDVSYNLVTEVYGYKNCSVYPDIVYSYKKVFRVEELADERNMIGVVPISFISQLKEGMKFQSQTEYCEYLMKQIEDNFIGARKIVLTSSCKDDEMFCEYFYKYLCENYDADDIIYRKYTTIEDYVNIIKRCQTVISGRMHAMILALIFGSNVVPIPFKEKLVCFRDNIATCYSDSVSECSYKGIEELVKCINR